MKKSDICPLVFGIGAALMIASAWLNKPPIPWMIPGAVILLGAIAVDLKD